jgi:hypothetical protein
LIGGCSRFGVAARIIAPLIALGWECGVLLPALLNDFVQVVRTSRAATTLPVIVVVRA